MIVNVDGRRPPGGGFKSLPPPSEPVQKSSRPSSNGGDSSPSDGGGGGGGGGSPPSDHPGSLLSKGGDSSSKGGDSSSNGGKSAPSSGGSPPSTSGGNSSSSPPSNGGSSSSTGGGPSPASDDFSSSTGGSFSPADGGGVISGTPSPSSSGGENHSSSSSSTAAPGTPSSPSTQTDPSIQPSAISGSTGDRALSQDPTSGGSPNFPSTSLANIPVADVPKSLPNPIQKGVTSGSTQTGHPSSTNGPNGTGTNNNPGSSALANPHHQLSSGGIAAIITVILLLFVAVLPFTVFILRRRSKIQRYERQKEGWSATFRTSQPYGDFVDAQLIPDRTQMVSSSLATNIGHSEYQSDPYVVAPLPPAMAEMGRGNASRPALVINTFDTNNDLERKRISIASAGSDRSQSVITSTSRDSLVNTPMYVRPFSTSESFAFPKPPESAGSAGGHSLASGTSRHTRRATSVTSAYDPSCLLQVSPSIVPQVTETRTIPTIDPFTGNNPFDDPTTPSTDNSVYWDAI